jgi:hypothetical protein
LETSPLPKEAGNQFREACFSSAGRANALTFDTRKLPSMLNALTVMGFPHSLF